MKAGIYSCIPQTANKPSNVDYGVLMVFGKRTEIASSSVQWIYQFFYETAGRIYRRTCINPGSLTPDTWTPWEIIAGGVEQIPNPMTINTVRASDLQEVSALKQGRIAQIKCYVVFKDILSNTWNTVATVDDSLKPVMETPLIVSEGAILDKIALFRLSTDGKIQVWGNQIVDGDTTRISATYFTAS